MVKIVLGTSSILVLASGHDVQQCAAGPRYMSAFYIEEGDKPSCTACGQTCCSRPDGVKYTWFDGNDPNIPGSCYCITGSSHSEHCSHAQSGDCNAWRVANNTAAADVAVEPASTVVATTLAANPLASGCPDSGKLTGTYSSDNGGTFFIQMNGCAYYWHGDFKGTYQSGQGRQGGDGTLNREWDQSSRVFSGQVWGGPSIFWDDSTTWTMLHAVHNVTNDTAANDTASADVAVVPTSKAVAAALAANPLRDYCGGNEFVGNPGSKEPHIHCGSNFLVYTQIGHAHTNCINKGKLYPAACKTALQNCIQDLGNQICSMTFGRACQDEGLSSNCNAADEAVQSPDVATCPDSGKLTGSYSSDNGGTFAIQMNGCAYYWHGDYKGTYQSGQGRQGGDGTLNRFWDQSSRVFNGQVWGGPSIFWSDSTTWTMLHAVHNATNDTATVVV